MRISIWHAVEHDGGTVTEMEVRDIHQFVQQTKINGGFFSGTLRENNIEFIPWHRINHIKQSEEPAPAQNQEQIENPASAEEQSEGPEDAAKERSE